MDDNLRRLLADQREFVRARDWAQFHTPKNLTMALGGEVGELACAVGHLLAASPTGLAEKLHTEVADELGDVALYLLRLYDVTGIDPQLGFGGTADTVPDSFQSPPTATEQFTVIQAVFELSGAAGRLLEAFQWEPNSASLEPNARLATKLPGLLHAIAECLQVVSELLGVNLIDAAAEKNSKNMAKYPVELSRGSSRKYTDLDVGTR